jgi:hypothetical protein
MMFGHYNITYNCNIQKISLTKPTYKHLRHKKAIGNLRVGPQSMLQHTTYNINYKCTKQKTILYQIYFHLSNTSKHGCCQP